MNDFIKKHSHGIVTTVTILVLLVFSYQVMSFLIGLKKEPERRQPRVQVRTVAAEAATYGNVVSPLLAGGRVISSREIVISSEVRGTIIEGDIPFKTGQSFKKGTVMIRIFDGNVVNNLKSRKSAFLQKIAGVLPDIKVDYTENYENWSAFFHSVDLAGDLPELPELISEQEKIFVASRNILTDYYSIKSDEITLDKHVIRAPFDGSFLNVSVEVGAIANPGAMLARIIYANSLELAAKVKVADAKWVTIGDKVKVMTSDISTQWDGEVTRISNFVDTATQSMNVFVKIKSTPENPVFKGQYLTAVFPGKSIGGVMEIARNAVFNSNEIFTVVDNMLVKQDIDIVKINENSLLFKGVDEGTDVVTEPLVNAMEGAKVQIRGRTPIVPDRKPEGEGRPSAPDGKKGDSQ